jgi:hypothetical protein
MMVEKNRAGGHSLVEFMSDAGQIDHGDRLLWIDWLWRILAACNEKI